MQINFFKAEPPYGRVEIVRVILGCRRTAELLGCASGLPPYCRSFWAATVLPPRRCLDCRLDLSSLRWHVKLG